LKTKHSSIAKIQGICAIFAYTVSVGNVFSSFFQVRDFLGTRTQRKASTPSYSVSVDTASHDGGAVWEDRREPSEGGGARRPFKSPQKDGSGSQSPAKRTPMRRNNKVWPARTHRDWRYGDGLPPPDTGIARRSSSANWAHLFRWQVIGEV